MSKIEEAKLRAFLRFKPTLEDTAAFFECSAPTVDRYIKKHFKCTFVEFRDQNMVHTRHALVRKAIDMAVKGNTAMIIFCLKNLCGWKDRFEHSGEESSPIKFAYDPTRKLNADV